jgi:hypothetical protein
MLAVLIYCRVDRTKHRLPDRGTDNCGAMASHQHEGTLAQRARQRAAPLTVGDQHIGYPVLPSDVENGDPSR